MLDLSITELETLLKMLEPIKEQEKIKLLYYKIVVAFKNKAEEERK